MPPQHSMILFALSFLLTFPRNLCYSTLKKAWSNDPTLLHLTIFDCLTPNAGPTFLLERMLDYVCLGQ